VRVFECHEGVWELAASKEEAHLQDVNHVAWNPTDPELLASCGDDCMIKLWRYSAPIDMASGS
jgi:cytosolic iron-sulfur protein assembly protein CIAO1